MSEAQKRIGYRRGSEEWKRKISKSLMGKHPSEETRRKLSEARKGKRRSEETKKKISEGRKGKLYPHKGVPRTEETKQKLRQFAFEYAKKTKGIIYPRIGRNEIQLLDELEKELNYRIIRQYKIGGYHLDGYIPEINLAIEVDEKCHENQKEKDIERENFIKQKLGCEFLRIKDYKEEREMVKRSAKKQGISESEVARRAIREYAQQIN